MNISEISEIKSWGERELEIAPSVEKLVKTAREVNSQLKFAKLAITQLTKLIEYLEEEIVEKDEIIFNLKRKS